MPSDLVLRPARENDHDAIWRVISWPIRAGDVFAIPPDTTAAKGLEWWFDQGHEVWVGEFEGVIACSYYLQANHGGPGAHVSNCGYATDPAYRGRGLAAAMCEHSLVRARARGFRAMQFNLVVATNTPAVDLWHRMGFETVGRVPEAFRHPTLGYVDALVMYQRL